MKKYMFLLLFVVFVNVSAQDNNRYLQDVVPVAEGKVVFSKEITYSGLTSKEVYNRLLDWAEERFQTTQTSRGRVAYTNQEAGQIVCRGDEYMVFAEKALSVDRARINYQLFFFYTEDKCRMELSNITYMYPDDKTKLTAEEWITDDKAMNKKRTRLYPGMGKFRIKTVDLAEDIFGKVEALFTANLSKSTAVNSISEIAPEVYKGVSSVNDLMHTSGLLADYKKVSPDKIPGNIIKLLSESWSLITAGNDEKFNMMTASWGGIGCLYGKPVSFCFVHPLRYTFEIMEEGEYYTISFYTEAHKEALEFCGRASGRDSDKVASSGLSPVTLPSGAKCFREAWMILECKKMVSQSMDVEGMNNESLKENWTGKPTHKMYIGEIINVWIK